MKKLLIILVCLLIVLTVSAQAVTTDANFDYAAISAHAQSHYGEVYTIVGRVISVEEYHRSSDTTIVEEYTKLAVDCKSTQIVCLHYTRPKNQEPMPFYSYVAVIAYVDGVQRVDTAVFPLMDSNSEPIILEEPEK